jgi:hypothetical protein
VNFTGEQIKELPTSRNVNSLLQLTPGINSQYRPDERRSARPASAWAASASSATPEWPASTSATPPTART